MISEIRKWNNCTSSAWAHFNEIIQCHNDTLPFSDLTINKCTSNILPSLIYLPTCTFPVSFSQWCPSNATLSWECPYTSPSTHSLINVGPWIHYHANSPYNCYATTAIHYACFKICSELQKRDEERAMLKTALRCCSDVGQKHEYRYWKKNTEQFSKRIATNYHDEIFFYVQYWK